MAPTLPPKHLPARDRRASKHSEQSQALLAAERAKTVKINARRELKLRRAEQQERWDSQVPATSNPSSLARSSQAQPSGKGKGPDRRSTSLDSSMRRPAGLQINPATPPSSAHATVNASIGAGVQAPKDDILEGVLAEERQWEEHIRWFAKHYPTRNVSTLDLEELVQLRREIGPGLTLPHGHNLYPKVRVELQPSLPSASNDSSSHRTFQTNSQKHNASGGLDIEQALGVNSSFDYPRAPPPKSAMRAGPPPHPAARRPIHSQPAPRSRRSDDNQVDDPHFRQAFPQPAQVTTSRHPPAPSNRREPNPPPSLGRASATPRRASAAGQQHVPRASSNRSSLSPAHTRPTRVNAPLPRAPSPPPQPVPRTRAPQSASELALNTEPTDFERIVHFIDDRIQGKSRDKPKRTEWSGLTLQLVDRAADDSKASLIAAGYMKTAEDRELIILQAWDRACEWYNVRRPCLKITSRQIRYIQNLYPSCRKFMKTRLETLVISKCKLWEGTSDEVKARVVDHLPHGFHTCPPSEEDEALPFEHDLVRCGIKVMIFRSPTDLGVRFNAFFNPVPPRLIAFVCAMIADIINEHASGAHRCKATYIENLRPLFNTYICSLKNLRLAQVDRYRNLLMRLHDLCIVDCGAMREEEADEPTDVLPVEAFSATPVEPYEPRYAAEQVQAMLTKDHIVDDNRSNSGLGCASEGDDDEPEEHALAGPGPSTLRNRALARAWDDEEYGWGGSGDDWGDGSGREEMGEEMGEEMEEEMREDD